MATRTIPETDISTDEANPTVSPSQNMGNGNRWVEVQLTSSEWDAKAGTGVVTWGAQYSPDNGATWRLLIGGPDDIGARGRDGLLPRVRLSATFIQQYAPMRARLFAWSTVPIKCGAVIVSGN